MFITQRNKKTVYCKVVWGT